MLEIISIILFAGITYTFLIVVPTIVEKVSSAEFRKAYFSHLSEKSVHSFGK